MRLKFAVFLIVFVLFVSLGIVSAVCPIKTLTIYSDDADTGLVPSAGETLIEVNNAAWFSKNLVGGGAEWIWETVYNPGVNESLNLTKTFNIPGNVETANFTFGFDNFLTLYVNGVKLLDHDPSTATPPTGICLDTPLPPPGPNVACCFCTRPHTIDISTFLTSGDNEIVFEIIGEGIPGSTAAANPAGLIYRIDVGYCEEPPTCPDNDRIMKLFSSTNSHGALWDYNGGNKIFYRCYKPSTGDHMTSVYSDCEVSLGTGIGYINEGILGYAFVSQIPGTVPLYRCYHPSGDHVNVLSSDCEGAPGYVRDYGTPIGYGYPSQELNTYQFNRCYNPSTGDHLDPWYPYDSCPSGYNLENLNFYIFNRMGYVYDICYSDIFGSAYTGANPHACTGTGAIPDNKVLGLFQENNSHAEIPNLDNYPIDVCYGDLECTDSATLSNICEEKWSNGELTDFQLLDCIDDSANCTDYFTGENYKTVMRLFQENNSHISNASDVNYPIKICCKSGAVTPPVTAQAYWADMMNNPINTADKNADVKLIVKDERFSQKHVNFTIYQPGGIVRKILSFITFGWISANPTTGEISGMGEAKWVTEPGNLYYFIATLANDDSVSIDSRIDPVYGYLNVSNVEINKPIKVDIIYPSINLAETNRRFKIGNVIPFELNISSPDDDVKIKWDFGDGTITEKTDCLSTNEESCKITNHSYSNWGTKIVYLNAEEMRRGQRANNYTIVFIYDEGINVFAVITSPLPDWVFDMGIKRIPFNASESYVANCTTGICTPNPYGISPCYDVDNLHCYEFDNKLGIPNNYNLWFDWSFSEGSDRYGNWTDNKQEVVEFEKVFYAPVTHWANLKVGYEPK